MIKPNNVLFYFVSGSKTFCTNATDEDLIGVRYEVEKRVDRYDGVDVFYWSLDIFRQLLKFKCPIETVAHQELYNISFAIKKEMLYNSWCASRKRKVRFLGKCQQILPITIFSITKKIL